MDHEYKVHHITCPTWRHTTTRSGSTFQGKSEAHSRHSPTTHDPYRINTSHAMAHTALHKIGECSSKKEEFLQKYVRVSNICSRQGNSILLVWPTQSLKWWMTKIHFDTNFIQERRPAHAQFQNREFKLLSLGSGSMCRTLWSSYSWVSSKVGQNWPQVKSDRHLKGHVDYHQWQWKRRNNKNGKPRRRRVPSLPAMREHHLSADDNSHNKSLRSQGASLPLLAQQYC